MRYFPPGRCLLIWGFLCCSFGKCSSNVTQMHVYAGVLPNEIQLLAHCHGQRTLLLAAGMVMSAKGIQAMSNQVQECC